MGDTKHLRALAVFAHPHDGTHLAGGTPALLAACGADVRPLCLTCGDAGCTLRPELVITFGPDGVTGHPDHVAVGEITTAATAIDVASVAEQKLAAEQWQCTGAQPRAEDVAAIGLTLTISEQFHRAVPAWGGGTMETALEGFLAGMPCRAPGRANRGGHETRRARLLRAA